MAKQPYIPPRRIGKYVQPQLFESDTPAAASRKDKNLSPLEIAILRQNVAIALAAIQQLKPHLYEQGMRGETEYERAVLALWEVERRLARSP